MLVGHDIHSSVEYSKFSVQHLNSGAFRPYNDDYNHAYDGKRLKWNNNFDELQKFLKNIVGLNGKWTSPGGNSKKFKSSNSDLTVTWYYGKQKTLLFQGKEGYLFREFLINICETKAVSVSPIEVKSTPRQVNLDKRSAGATRVYFDDLTNTSISEDTASVADTSTLKELEDFIDNSFYNATALPRDDCTRNFSQEISNSTPLQQRVNDNSVTMEARFFMFKEKIESEMVNLLEKLSEQVKIINTSKQDLCRLNRENLILKLRISELKGKVFSIEKSHGNRNKSINSEMVKENPVNSIINDGKSLKEVYRCTG
jgi:hypothetical protein